MNHKSLWTLFLICAVGCQSQPIQVVDNASPVIRRHNRKKGRIFQRPIETVSFGSFEVASPNQSGVGTNVRQAAFSREKVRQESSIKFDLKEHGKIAAHIEGRSLRKFGRLTTRIGNFSSDSFDLLDGTIELSSGTKATFDINNFHSDEMEAMALGKVIVGDNVIVVREIERPGDDLGGAGFPGANCFWGNRRIAQVVLRREMALIHTPKSEEQSVWVDPKLPDDIRIAANGICAILLITRRIEHHD